jgi:hypothetical protein
MPSARKALRRKGDLLVVFKSQAGEFPLLKHLGVSGIVAAWFRHQGGTRLE